MSGSRLATRLLYALTLPVILVTIWWYVSATSPTFFFPPLSDIVQTFVSVWFSDRLLLDVLPSVSRALTGYLIALALGILIGVPVGSSRAVRETLTPILEFLRAVPPPVMVPLLIIFAGIGDEMKIFLIVAACVWPVLLNSIAGARGVDEVLRDTAVCYRLRAGARVFMILRAASPQIAAGARQSLSIAILMMVVSEMFAAVNGLGFAIIQFQRSFQIASMWSGIILLGIIGVVFAGVFRLVETRVLAWYHGFRKTETMEGSN